MGKGNKPAYYDERERPHYLTIYRPYPINASMDIEADRMVFSYWVASCIGRENLLAFFHKPKSPSMMIIEVMPSFTEFKVILGEHSWARFLRNPSAQEKTMCSQVFHCQYSTMREVEKYGWKRIDLKDEWFISKENIVKWHRINNVITYPYPPTQRCEPPLEDPTREKLCRPLPVKQFPVASAVRPLPVGSPQWQKQREAEALAQRASTRRAGPPASPTEAAQGNITRNLSGWAQDRAPAYVKAQGSLPPGLVPSPSAAAPPGPSVWNTGPPGLVRDRGGAQSQLSGSDSGHSSESAAPLTPPDAPVMSVSASALGDDEESDEDLDVDTGMPTTGNILGFAPEEVVPKRDEPDEQPWKPPPWLIQPEKPAPKGDEFRCTTHHNGRCKPALCQEHRDWVRAQKRKAEGNGNGWGKRGNNNGRAESTARGRERDNPPHLKSRSSRSSSTSERDRSSSPASERSERRAPARAQPRAGTKAKPNFERAEVRPAHLLNRGAAPVTTKGKPSTSPSPSPPDSVSTDTANPAARPAFLTKQRKGANTPAHLRKGKQEAATASPPAEPAPAPASRAASVDQWRAGVRSGAPSEAGGDDAQSEDNWGNVSTGSDIWGRDDDAENTKGKADFKAVDENVPVTWGGVEDSKGKAKAEAPDDVQINGGGVEEELAPVWGESPAPSERGALDDAQSVGGWDNVSLGFSQWRNEGGQVFKQSQHTPFVGPTHARGDAASVSGWSAVSKGAGQWPEDEPAPKDDDAVSVASTVGPANARKHAAAGDAKAKGKENKRNKKKKNQNQAQPPPPQQQQQVPTQNTGRAAAVNRWRANNAPCARAPAPWSATTSTKAPGPTVKVAAAVRTARTPATKPVNATSSTQGKKMSWAEQMEADDDNRSVVTQGWSKVAW